MESPEVACNGVVIRAVVTPQGEVVDRQGDDLVSACSGPRRGIFWYADPYCGSAGVGQPIRIKHCQPDVGQAKSGQDKVNEVKPN